MNGYTSFDEYISSPFSVMFMYWVLAVSLVAQSDRMSGVSSTHVQVRPLNEKHKRLG